MSKVYLVYMSFKMDDKPINIEALIKANSRKAAERHFAANAIGSRVASQEDLFRVAKSGGAIMDLTATPAEPAPLVVPEPSNE